MEDEKIQTLRRKIQEIQKDASLSNAEKAKKIQLLMSGKKESPKEQKTEGKEEVQSAVALTSLNKEKTFQNKEQGILGCSHYRVNCKIRAACCGQLFTCRLCHDEDHKIDRYSTKEMMCMFCDTLQPVAQNCTSCSKQLSKYYCDVCKFHDDTPNKHIYHCPDCGICRLGKGLEIDFYHCPTCNVCLNISMKNKHICIENNMKSNCSICHNDLFTSRMNVTVLKCGHPMHVKCFEEYLQAREFTCPLCSKSIVDMSRQWLLYDRLIQIQPMPSEFAESKANILCCDCNKKSEIAYHFVGLKCADCGSYNTKIVSTSNMPTGPITSTIPQVTEEQLSTLAQQLEEELDEGEESEEISSGEGEAEEQENSNENSQHESQ